MNVLEYRGKKQDFNQWSAPLICICQMNFNELHNHKCWRLTFCKVERNTVKRLAMLTVYLNYIYLSVFIYE